MYGKLFASMFDGSLYGNWQAIVTLQQLVILCDAQGVVDMTPQAIAARTSIPLEIITAGLAVLEAPDQYSRTPGNEGRRIERLDPDIRPWGWRIVNYAKYRGMVSAEQRREQDRIRQQAKRERDRSVTQRDVLGVSQSVTESHAASDAVTQNPQSHAKQKQKQKKEKKGQDAAQWECPHDVDQAAWDDWMRLRDRKKAAISERALTAALEKLDQARRLGLDPSAIVARSADRGWTDLYLPDAPRRASSQQHQQQQVGEFGLFDTTGAFGGPSDGH